MNPLSLLLLIAVYFSLLMIIYCFASRYNRFLFPFFLLALSWHPATSQHNARQGLATEIGRILQSEVDSGKIPGAVVVIKKGDQVLLQKAYGYARKVGFEQKPLAAPEKTSLQHLYDIASLTKVIGTTTSIMLLVDKGLIRVDDPVGKYIEAFQAPEKKAITIRHLLTHSAGLYEWYPMYYRASNKQECYRLIGELPLRFPVGAQRRYSDLGFVLLGQIIETVSGLPLERFMEENIFKPLGMAHTAYNPGASGRFPKIAATSHGNPYEKRMVYDASLGFQVKEIDPASWNGWRKYTLVGEVNDGNAWYANGGVSGAAGLFSTAGDLQLLVDMLKNKGMAAGRRFLSAKTIEIFLTPDSLKNGLGWVMDPSNPLLKNAPIGSYGHTGFTGTSISVVPEYGLSVILLINRQNVGLLPSGAYYNVNSLRERVFGVAMKYGAN
ncbi:MAG: serine hydrolase [Haliscomenobacter sp.]|nr:serine hydrolase [Haliscomenobacter sp.]